MEPHLVKNSPPEQAALQLKLQRLITRAIAAPLLLVTFSGGISAWAIVTLRSHERAISHTEEVVAVSNEAFRLMISQETTIRGLLITRDEVFLQPFDESSQALRDVMIKWTNLVADNPQQQERLAQIVENHKDWLNGLTEARKYALEQTVFCSANPACVDALKQRRLKGRAVRTLVDDMLAEESRLLQQRTKRADDVTQLALMGGVASLLMLGLLIATTLRKWIAEVGRMYAKALTMREESETQEREARRIAEAMGTELIAASAEMETRFRAVLEERDRAMEQLAARGDPAA